MSLACKVIDYSKIHEVLLQRLYCFDTLRIWKTCTETCISLFSCFGYRKLTLQTCCVSLLQITLTLGNGERRVVFILEYDRWEEVKWKGTLAWLKMQHMRLQHWTQGDLGEWSKDRKMNSDDASLILKKSPQKQAVSQLHTSLLTDLL